MPFDLPPFSLSKYSISLLLLLPISSFQPLSHSFPFRLGPTAQPSLPLPHLKTQADSSANRRRPLPFSHRKPPPPLPPSPSLSQTTTLFPPLSQKTTTATLFLPPINHHRHLLAISPSNHHRHRHRLLLPISPSKQPTSPLSLPHQTLWLPSPSLTKHFSHNTTATATASLSSSPSSRHRHCLPFNLSLSLSLVSSLFLHRESAAPSLPPPKTTTPFLPLPDSRLSPCFSLVNPQERARIASCWV